jgi:glycine/D-amino acid oxidase-like deaminating enzyme
MDLSDAARHQPQLPETSLSPITPARISTMQPILSAVVDVRVIIIDRAPQIGATMGDGIRPSIIEASEHLGVEWVVNASVAAVDANGVTLADDRHIEAQTVIWTVGFRASPLTKQLTSDRDPQGRLHVDANWSRTRPRSSTRRSIPSWIYPLAADRATALAAADPMIPVA